MREIEQFESEYKDIYDAIRGVPFPWVRWSTEANADVHEVITPEPHIDGEPYSLPFIEFRIHQWRFSIASLNRAADWTSALPAKRSDLTSMCIRRFLVMDEGTSGEDTYPVSYGAADTVAELVAWLQVEFARTPYPCTEEDED